MAIHKNVPAVRCIPCQIRRPRGCGRASFNQVVRLTNSSLRPARFMNTNTPIFHFSVSCISRSKGTPCTRVAAYISGERIVDERTGLTFDFRSREDVQFSRLILPSGAPKWSRSECWNASECANTRSNSRTARTCVAALPQALSFEDQLSLASKMGEWICKRYTCVVDWSLHIPPHEKDLRNVHIHFLMSTRRVNKEGYTEKTRELDAMTTGPAEIRKLREQWSEFVNHALTARSIERRVDHRSHKDRGIDLIPTIKEGRGRGSKNRKRRNKEIIQRNRQMAEIKAELLALIVERQKNGFQALLSANIGTFILAETDAPYDENDTLSEERIWARERG